MAGYLKMANMLLAYFHKVTVSQISREKNSHVKSLATLASSMDNCVPQIISVKVLDKLSIEPKLNVSMVSVTSSSWMDPILMFFI